MCRESTVSSLNVYPYLWLIMLHLINSYLSINSCWFILGRSKTVLDSVLCPELFLNSFVVHRFLKWGPRTLVKLVQHDLILGQNSQYLHNFLLRWQLSLPSSQLNLSTSTGLLFLSAFSCADVLAIPSCLCTLQKFVSSVCSAFHPHHIFACGGFICHFETF